MSTIKTFRSTRERCQHLILVVNDQLFAVPIEQVHGVFTPSCITRIPLAHKAIAGILNFRGNILTAIDMRILLSGTEAEYGYARTLGIETWHTNGSNYCLLVDDVEGVHTFARKNPLKWNNMALDPILTLISLDIYWFDKKPVLVLDTDSLLSCLLPESLDKEGYSEISSDDRMSIGDKIVKAPFCSSQ